MRSACTLATTALALAAATSLTCVAQNELAATMAKPQLVETEFAAMMKRLALPPALPGEELLFNQEH